MHSRPSKSIRRLRRPRRCETDKERNVPSYARQRFTLQETVRPAADGPPTWTMRPPSRLSAVDGCRRYFLTCTVTIFGSVGASSLAAALVPAT